MPEATLKKGDLGPRAATEINPNQSRRRRVSRIVGSPHESPGPPRDHRLRFLTLILTLDLMKATVTSKGQITIPIEVRKRLKLEQGTVLIFDQSAGYLKATKRKDRASMQKVIGMARDEFGTKDTAELLEELRGPIELPRRPR